MKYRKFYLEIM